MATWTSRKSGIQSHRLGFTLIEMVTVIVILGILSAVVVPVFVDYKSSAKVSTCKGVLGVLRSSIADYYNYTSMDAGGGVARYPTLVQLRTVGVVLRSRFPDNPFDTDATKNNVVNGSGRTMGTVVGTSGGWCYNPTTGDIWANTSAAGENNF